MFAPISSATFPRFALVSSPRRLQIEMAEIAKIIAKEWRGMTQEQKAPFLAMAREAKAEAEEKERIENEEAQQLQR